MRFNAISYRSLLRMTVLVPVIMTLGACQWLSDFRDRQQPKIAEPSPALVKKDVSQEDNVKVANYPIQEKL